MIFGFSSNKPDQLKSQKQIVILICGMLIAILLLLSLKEELSELGIFVVPSSQKKPKHDASAKSKNQLQNYLPTLKIL
jgi:hypothetical protein